MCVSIQAKIGNQSMSSDYKLIKIINSKQFPITSVAIYCIFQLFEEILVLKIYNVDPDKCHRMQCLILTYTVCQGAL